MDPKEFAACVEDTAALLKSMKPFLPKHIDDELLDFLTRLKDDPAGLEFLRNAIAPKK